MSEESSTDFMDLEEALLADPQIEGNLRRLQEEEKVLLEQQVLMEAGNVDDITALEHQDALRHNQIQQRALLRQQATVQRLLARQAELQAQAQANDLLRYEQAVRRRAACNVRVNNLHAAVPDAYETDV